MREDNFSLVNKKVRNTWCLGCGNFGIFSSLKQSIICLIKERKIAREKIVLVGGIGCHAKTLDYLSLNSFYSLHGRPIATAQGINIANPKLKVIVIAGDGDTYDEGANHLIHAARRNANMTVLVFNNRNFALTSGQFTSSSPKGFKGKSTPFGSVEESFNPLRLVLTAGATFVARGYSMKVEHLTEIIKRAIEHKGFSFVDILEPCVSFFDDRDFYKERIYEMRESDLEDEKKAWEKAGEWDYGKKGKIPIGIFWETKKEIYEKKTGEKIDYLKNKADFKKITKELE